MVDFSMGPPPAPGGPRAFGGGAGSAQAFTGPAPEGDDLDLDKPAPVLDSDSVFRTAEAAASDDLTEINQILAEFEELGHEFELWSQRLITIQDKHNDDLKGKVQQLEADFLEQEERREFVLEFVREMTAIRNNFTKKMATSTKYH